jgi:hypothetical protein
LFKLLILSGWLLAFETTNHAGIEQAVNDHVLLVSQLRLAGNNEGIAVTGDYAYLAAGEAGLQIIDVSTPANPHRIGFKDTPGTARDVAVVNHHAFLADGSNGLLVIDVSAPTSPVTVGFHPIPGEARRLDVATDLVYLAASSGLHIIDITDVANPIALGSYQTNANDVEVVGQYAYLAETVTNDCDEMGGVLRVLDISDPTEPVSLGSSVEPGCHPYNWHFLGITIGGSYAYVGTRNRIDGGVYVFDVSAPTNLNQVGKGYSHHNGYVQEVLVKGDRVYAAWSGSGLVIADFAIPVQPKRIGFYDTPGYAADIAVANGLVYVADERGMVILRPLLYSVNLPAAFK